MSVLGLQHRPWKKTFSSEAKKACANCGAELKFKPVRKPG